MRCAALAVTEQGYIFCAGYESNPCCSQHQGCDAICLELGRGTPKLVLVEVKRGEFDSAEAGRAVVQLDLCRQALAAPVAADIVYAVVADSYTQNAVRRLEREARRRHVSLKRLKPGDPLADLALKVSK